MCMGENCKCDMIPSLMTENLRGKIYQLEKEMIECKNDYLHFNYVVGMHNAYRTILNQLEIQELDHGHLSHYYAIKVGDRR